MPDGSSLVLVGSSLMPDGSYFVLSVMVSIPTTANPFGVNPSPVSPKGEKPYVWNPKKRRQQNALSFRRGTSQHADQATQSG
jgi:hypothetical protein